MPITAIALEDTYLKELPTQSDDQDDVVFIKAGKSFELNDYVCIDELTHNYFVLATPIADGESRWFAYCLHWKIEGTEDGNNPTEAVPNSNTEVETPEPEPLPVFFVPGISSPLKADSPIYFEDNEFTKDNKASHFTWGEATKGGSRIPVDAGITANIIKLARYMDKVRFDLGGNAIVVTSWYRDPVSNREVGGARWSQHLAGNAIDFYVEVLGVVDTFNKLKRFGGGRLSLAVGNGFVHLDLRPGGPARWTYAGGPQVSLW